MLFQGWFHPQIASHTKKFLLKSPKPIQKYLKKVRRRTGWWIQLVFNCWSMEATLPPTYLPPACPAQVFQVAASSRGCKSRLCQCHAILFSAKVAPVWKAFAVNCRCFQVLFRLRGKRSKEGSAGGIWNTLCLIPILAKKGNFYKYWCKWKICHFYWRNLFINKSFSIWRWTLISIISWHSLVNSCPQELVHLDHGPYSCQLIIWGAECTDLMLNISSISTVSTVLITHALKSVELTVDDALYD